VPLWQNQVNLMDHKVKIRLAEERDFEGMLKIYAPFVTNTSVTFEYEVPSLEEYSKRIQNISSHYPCFVCEVDGKVEGYAYASIYRIKTAYQWSVESTIYVSSEYQGKGVARWLYEALFCTLELQGFINVYAVITLPNKISEQFHLNLGFAQVGLFENIGYKLGKWHNLMFLEMFLSEHVPDPPAPDPIHEVKGLPEFARILEVVNEGLVNDSKWK
jgi:L-amino acid N-acyltransferase YncA